MTLRDDDQSCGCINQDFIDILQKIKDAFYGPVYKNSNSTVGTMLRSAGAPFPELPVWAPRFDVQLDY